jgi:hypothetical protein
MHPLRRPLSINVENTVAGTRRAIQSRCHLPNRKIFIDRKGKTATRAIQARAGGSAVIKIADESDQCTLSFSECSV